MQLPRRAPPVADLVLVRRISRAMKVFYSRDVTDWLCVGAQFLLILLFIASVAAFVVGIRCVPCRPQRYFSALFFLALFPFIALTFAAAIRLCPIFYRIDDLANARQLLSYAVMPFYLGTLTTTILVVVYSVFHARHQ